MQAYQNLKKRFATIRKLKDASSILEKDSETMMPKGSVDDYVGQTTAIGEVLHMLITDPKVSEWLKEAQENKASLPPDDQRNLDLMYAQWVHGAALTPELAEEVARVYSEGGQLHTDLHKSGDWSKMQDWYTYSFDVMRRVGELKAKALGLANPYDALLDSFSPGLRVATIEKEFAVLERELPHLIAQAKERQKALPAPIPLKGPFDRKAQEELCARVLRGMGFDNNRGRLYFLEDGHPSCGGSPDDVRMTARFGNENDFIAALYAAIHEAGHGMYDQNQPKEWRYQPAGADLGMAIHETQSMIMELQASQTPEFLSYLERTARELFNRPDDPALSGENLGRLMQKVQSSFIRIEADEMTYPAHIVLRVKLESGLVNGEYDVKDLPRLWGEGMKQLLGITPPDNAKGCMQDVHWPCGYTGYFPAYTLGAAGAAQFFRAACKAQPELRAKLAEGDFTPLREWLRDNVHGKGSLLTSDELFRRATGEPLNMAHYLNHLSERYVGKPFAPAAGTQPAARAAGLSPS